MLEFGCFEVWRGRGVEWFEVREAIRWIRLRQEFFWIKVIGIICRIATVV